MTDRNDMANTPQAVKGSQQSHASGCLEILAVPIVGLPILALLAFGIWFFTRSAETMPPWINPWASYSACEHFIGRAIETPSSARFAGRFSGDTQVGNDHSSGAWRYRIASYVDAQNLAGAMVRTRFLCTATWRSNSQWVLDDLNMTPWIAAAVPDQSTVAPLEEAKPNPAAVEKAEEALLNYLKGK